jgi:hypothetical protein
MMMKLSYITPVWFVLLQVSTLIDVEAEITLTEIGSSFSTNYYDLDSELSGSFTQGEDGVSFDASGTNIPSSVPGSYLPVPTTLSPTDSEAPTSEVVRIAMRGLAQGTMKPSPQDTTAPTPTLLPTNSFAVSPLVEESRILQNDTERILQTATLTPTTTPVTLAPVSTNAPTDSEAPTLTETITGSQTGTPTESQTDAPTEVPTGAHSVQIDVTYDDKPEEVSWFLMKHPATVEVEMGFNSTYIQAGKTSTFVVDQLQEGKYYFRITDVGKDGLGISGNYRIIDTSNGGFRLIHQSSGDFGWFDYKEFYLGTQRDFYIYGYDQKVETATDKFYTLSKLS